jgi:flavin reductase (DIM6/NTAB) family NADH-FMN oxidoreductase RutF
MVQAASHCAGDFEADVDESEISGLTKSPSVVVKPPFVTESAFSMECKLVSATPIVNDAGTVTTHHVIARVVQFHAAADLLEKTPNGSNMMNFAKGSAPLGRLGGNDWVTMGEKITIARPKV